MNRVGLAVVRLQPLHNGHCRIIDSMIRAHHTVILGIGSTQKNREKDNPWTFEERKKMVHNVYGDRVKIIQLKDLGTTEKTNDWVDYVLDKIRKVGLQEPTDYYTGSKADAVFYLGRFKLDDDSKDEHIFKENSKRLHIIERTDTVIPSATELRTFIELRNDGWKEWVPRVNWEIVENNFPEEFRVKTY